VAFNVLFLVNLWILCKTKMKLRFLDISSGPIFDARETKDYCDELKL